MRPRGQPPAPLLAAGASGSLLVLHEVLAHAQAADLEEAHHAFTAAAASAFTMHAGLFNGHAGVVLALDRVAQEADSPAAALAREAVPAHLAALEHGVVEYDGGPMVLGHDALRLSTDLGTGTAGLVLALSAVLDERRPAAWPFVG